MRFIFACAFCAATSAVFAQVQPGEVVINEVGIVQTGTDNLEFVELMNKTGAPIDISGLTITFHNSVNAGTNAIYRTHTFPAPTNIAAGGFFVLGPAGVNGVVPGSFNTAWPASDAIQNGDPDSIRLFRTSDNVTIDALQYWTQYDTTPGVAENGSGTAATREGDATGTGGTDTFNVQTGTGAVAARTNISTGRVPDGTDTDNNFNDFINQWHGRSPGASNNPPKNDANIGTPMVEDFSQATGLAYDWAPRFTSIVLETAASAVPAAIPNSPDPTTPGEWASLKDNTGGGESAIIPSFIGRNYNVSADFYCGAISSITETTETEVGALMGRYSNGHRWNSTGSADGNYDMTVPIGVYGDSYYGLEMSYTTGTVTAIKVLKSTRTELATVPVSVGWHKLELRMVGDVIQYAVDGTIFHQLTGEVSRPGSVGIGYRELAATAPYATGSVRNNFDNLRIETGLVPVSISAFAIE